MQLDALKTTTDDRKDCSMQKSDWTKRSPGKTIAILASLSTASVFGISIANELDSCWNRRWWKSSVDFASDLAGWLVLMFLCPRAPLSAIGVKKWPIICICTHIIKQVQDNNFLNRRFISLVCIQKLTVFARKPVDEATGRGYLGSLSMKPDLYVLLMRPASLRSLQWDPCNSAATEPT